MKDTIGLTGLHVDCCIGIFEKEQQTSQPVIVDLELMLNLREAALEGHLSKTVDYDQIQKQVSFILKHSRFRLLETAAEAICTYLLSCPTPGEMRAPIEEVQLTLSKPHALEGQVIPSIRIHRDHSSVRLEKEVKAFGTVDVIFESPYAGLYRLNVEPGKKIPLHVHKQMHEAEMVLTEGLLCNDKPRVLGSTQVWNLDEPHDYHNPTNITQSILCIDRPPFIPEDEIIVNRS